MHPTPRLGIGTPGIDPVIFGINQSRPAPRKGPNTHSTCVWASNALLQLLASSPRSLLPTPVPTWGHQR